MQFAETALLLACRTVLRMPLNERGGGFSAKECEIEADEMAPATVGDLYVVVRPGGFKAGPRHNTSGGIWDLIFGVDVLVIKRIGATPRDRMRELFIGSPYLGNLDSLGAEMDRVINALDFDRTYLVNRTANELIEKENGTKNAFVEPLKFVGVDKSPRVAAAELFGGTGTKAGLIRGVYFHGARLVKTRG